MSNNIKNQSTRNFLFIAFLLLGALMTLPVFAIDGIVEFPVIKSKVLADAGISPSEHELGVYLPPGYATSGLAYPVMYLFHGSAGTDRGFFGPQALYIQDIIMRYFMMLPP